MGNLPSSCLVLRVFGPRVWFEDRPGRVVSAIGQVFLLSIQHGLCIMKESNDISRVFMLPPSALSSCGTNHATSALQSPH